MTEFDEDVVAELGRLRKGKGMLAADIEGRMGPRMRELASRGSGATVRASLDEALTRCAQRLEGEPRDAVLAALAMHRSTRSLPRFENRVDWLAKHLSVSARTAVRRIDDAQRLLAEEVVRELLATRGPGEPVSRGWVLRRFHTLLRLDSATPEAYETRRIRAVRDGLTEVMAWLDVPRDATSGGPTLTGEVTHGGRLVARRQPRRDQIQFVVQLPVPLRAGDEHEYGLHLRVQEGQPIRPHYVFTPECQCDEFVLHLRFDPGKPPRWLRRVDGETVRTFDAAGSAGEPITLDRAGEAELVFANPVRYLGYGAQWSF